MGRESGDRKLRGRTLCLDPLGITTWLQRPVCVMSLGFCRHLSTFLSTKNIHFLPHVRGQSEFIRKSNNMKVQFAREAPKLRFCACLLPDKSEFFQISHYEQSWNKLSWKLNKVKNMRAVFVWTLMGKKINFQLPSDLKFFRMSKKWIQMNLLGYFQHLRLYFNIF